MSVESAKVWLVKAGNALRSAEASVNVGVFDMASFEIHLVIEMSYKIAMVFNNTPFPHPHDLQKLYSLIPGDWRVKDIPCDFAQITTWNVSGRYCDTDYDEPNESEVRAGLETARAVYGAIKADIAKRIR